MELTGPLKEHLLRFSLLKDFGQVPGALDALAPILQEQRFASRETIIDERDTALQMYFLIRGQASVQKRSEGGQIVLLGKLKQEHFPFLGESAMLGHSSRSAYVVADTECSCLILRREDFERFSKTFPAATLSFYRNLAQGLYDRMKDADRNLFILSLG